MSTPRPVPDGQDPRKITSRKVFDLPETLTVADDSLTLWAERYLDLAVQRRLGHANDRYLRLYTNPPDDIAASYVEDL